jgi:broad specificity polyphosphatase/5'/3'-nucleotidase SurE
MGTGTGTGTGAGTETGTVTGTVTGTGMGTVTISISALTREQQKILYTHKHCEIKHIRKMRFLFCFFYI